MYYVRRKALTGELPPGLQRGNVRITGLKAPGPIATGNKFGYSTSRFTVNQAHSPSASATLGTQPSTTLRPSDPTLPSTASTAMSNFSTSTRHLGLTSSVNATSFRGLDNNSRGTSFRSLESNGRGTSFRGLDSTVSGIDRVSGNDFNSSYVSGMDFSDRASNDLNASARSLNLNASTRSLLAVPSPTSSDNQSPSAAVDQTGKINLMAASPSLFTPPIDEDRSENFVLPIEGDNDDEEVQEEDGTEEEDYIEEAPLAVESSKELSPRPPQRVSSIDSFQVPTIQEEHSEDFSVSNEFENKVEEEEK